MSGQGNPYYYNVHTQVSQWERPSRSDEDSHKLPESMSKDMQGAVPKVEKASSSTNLGGEVPSKIVDVRVGAFRRTRVMHSEALS